MVLLSAQRPQNFLNSLNKEEYLVTCRIFLFDVEKSAGRIAPQHLLGFGEIAYIQFLCKIFL